MQGDATVSGTFSRWTEWQLGAVKDIAANGKTAHGSLNADLVHPACLGTKFHQRSTRAGLQTAIMKERLPGVCASFERLFGTRFLRQFPQPVVPGSLVRTREKITWSIS
jgi:hypothetical protein